MRSFKGNEINFKKIKFKSGDSLLSCAKTMSNKQTVFIDSRGKSYSVFSHTFPSARGFGEPLTGRLTINLMYLFKQWLQVTIMICFFSSQT